MNGTPLPAGQVRRSCYAFVEVTEKHVVIADLDLPGTLSITNNAEAVVREVLATYPGRRIGYRDTDGQLDELVHDGHGFVRFAFSFTVDPCT